MAATVAKMLMPIDCSMVTDDPKRVRATLDRSCPNYIVWGVALEGNTPKLDSA